MSEGLTLRPPFNYWLSDSPFACPAAFKPALDGFPVNAEFSRPTHDGLSTSVDRHKMIIRTVVFLLMHCCPTAISRHVPLRIINAVNRVFNTWRFPHIFKELFKRSPSIANNNSFGRVVFEKFTIRGFTPLMHSRPNSIYSGPSHPMSRIALYKRPRDAFFIKTAARLTCAFAQGLTLYKTFCPTIANAYPARSWLRVVRISASANNRQASKFLASKINKLSHNQEYRGLTLMRQGE